MPEQHAQKQPNILLIVLGVIIAFGAARIINGLFFGGLLSTGPTIETYCYRINLPASWEGDYTVSSCEDHIASNYRSAGCITVVTRTSTGERFVVGVFTDNWDMDEWIARDYDEWAEEVDLSWATPETHFDQEVAGWHQFKDYLVVVGGVDGAKGSDYVGWVHPK